MNDNYQTNIEAALRTYTRAFVIFTVVGVPIGFFVGPNWVSMLIGVLVCLAGIVQLVLQWAVYG
jgi:hypothetical protein